MTDKKKIQIAHIYPSVLRMHGASKCLLLFTTTLQEKGYDNTIYCDRFNIDKPFWFKGDIKPLFKKRIESKEPAGVLKILSIIGQIAMLKFMPFFIPRDVDVLIFHGEQSSFAIPFAKLLFRKKKIIYYCYQIPRELYDLKEVSKQTYGMWYWVFWPFFELYKFLHKWFVSLSDYILVWSSQMVEETKKVFGDLNYIVVPTGVDFRTFEKITEKEEKVNDLRQKLNLNGEKVLLMNGALIRKKNIPQFIQLVKDLTDQDYQVRGLVIGEGPEQASYQAMIDELGIEKHFTLLGYVSQEELPLYYFLSDILLFLEYNGPWTMSIIEAGAAHKPVIVSSGGSMPTLVDHENSGFILTNLEEQLGSTTKRLLDSNELLHQMGEKNYSYSLQFSSEGCLNQFLKVL